MLEKQLPDISEAYVSHMVLYDGTRLLVFGGTVACPLSLDRLLFSSSSTYFQSSLSQNHIFVPIFLSLIHL